MVTIILANIDYDTKHLECCFRTTEDVIIIETTPYWDDYSTMYDLLDKFDILKTISFTSTVKIENFTLPVVDMIYETVDDVLVIRKDVPIDYGGSKRAKKAINPKRSNSNLWIEVIVF